jgi:hypothetical protein
VPSHFSWTLTPEIRCQKETGMGRICGWTWMIVINVLQKKKQKKKGTAV